MLNIDFAARVLKFLKRLPLKHERQVVQKVVSLAHDPRQQDVKALKGYSPLCRADIGEYRVIFYTAATTLYIVLVGKRNDSEVYKRLDRLF